MPDKAIRTVEVRLMGALECRYEGRRLELAYNTGSKMSQLLLMLLFSAHRGVPRAHILEALYQGRDVDAVNSLKTLFSRLRSAFSEALGLPGGEGLTLVGGIYDVAPGVEVLSDTAEFCALCDQAAAETDKNRRVSLLDRACQTYTGELLPSLSEESWVIFENAALYDRYFRAVRELCAEYESVMDYESESLCYRRALSIFPLEESFMLGRINSLLALGQYNTALTEYEEMTAQLFDELGVYPSEKLMDVLRRISDKLDFSITTAENISHSLEEDEAQGAYYCSYPNFLSSYRILRRVMLRDEDTATKLLFTVVDADGRPLENKGEVSAAIAALHIALGRSLRRSDMFTRFSRTQLLVMLWNSPPDKAHIAIERVTEQLEKDKVPGASRFICTVVSDTELPALSDSVKHTGAKTWVGMK